MMRPSTGDGRQSQNRLQIAPVRCQVLVQAPTRVSLPLEQIRPTWDPVLGQDLNPVLVELASSCAP